MFLSKIYSFTLNELNQLSVMDFELYYTKTINDLKEKKESKTEQNGYYV